MPLGNIAALAAIMCDAPLDYELRDGLFYITDPNVQITRVLRPVTFLQSFQRAAQAIQQYYATEEGNPGAEIIVFPDRAAG